MGLVMNTRTDTDFVDAAGDPRLWCIGRQLFPGNIVIARGRNRRGGGRNQAIGALQIVVLERWLVNLGREGNLVLCVGLDWIQMLGALIKGGIKNVAAATIASGIGIIPGTVATSGQKPQYHDNNKFSHQPLEHERQCSGRLRQRHPGGIGLMQCGKSAEVSAIILATFH